MPELKTQCQVFLNYCVNLCGNGYATGVQRGTGLSEVAAATTLHLPQA